MNQKSHLLQIFFFAIKNEFLLFKVNKQGRTNRLNVERLSLILFCHYEDILRKNIMVNSPSG